MATAPLQPVGCVAGRFRPVQCRGEETPDLADGKRDEASACGRRRVGACWRGGLGVGAIPELCGGDGADRKGGHDQDDVPQDCGVEPGLSSRWDLPGDLSPAYWAIDHPFRDGRSLASTFRYFPACSRVCVRTKQERSSPIRAARSRSAQLAPSLAAPAALCSFALTSSMVEGGRVHAARFRADAAYLRTGSPALRAAGTGTSRSGGRPALA
jgi:hypothetical protein